MSFFYRSHTGKIFGRKVGSKIYDAVIYAIPTLLKSIITRTCRKNIFYKNDDKAIGEADISKRRTFFSVPFSGSLTVEAALVMPIFLGAVLLLTGIFQTLEVYEQVNSYLCSTGRKLAAYSEAADGVDRGDLYKLFYADLRNSGIESDDIVGGMAGLVPVMTKESDLVKIKVTYFIKSGGFFFFSRNIRITDSVYVCPWLGASPGRNKKDSDNQQSKIVYVAENGVVYHQSESCSYLKLSIRQCRQEDIQALRNKYGAKYVQCERCGKHAAGNETVYITDTGRAWHTDRTCSGLKRILQTMTQDEAEEKGLRSCSRCC